MSDHDPARYRAVRERGLAAKPRSTADAETRLHSLVIGAVFPRRPDEHGSNDGQRHENRDKRDDAGSTRHPRECRTDLSAGMTTAVSRGTCRSWHLPRNVFFARFGLLSVLGKRLPIRVLPSAANRASPGCVAGSLPPGTRLRDPPTPRSLSVEATRWGSRQS